MSDLRRLLLAQALARQARAPSDRAGFERLVGPAGELGGVTATCFLLHRAERAERVSTHRFLRHLAPRLLAQLARSTRPQRVLLRGRARGAVDWSATVRARYGGSQDPTIFVCRQSWRLYDLPENQLLKYLLDRLRRCHERSPEELRAFSSAGSGSAIGLSDRLAFVAQRLRSFSATAYLRDVELPDAIDEEHLQAAKQSRNPLYRQTAAYFRLFRDVVEQPRWSAWRQVVQQNVLLLPSREARTLRRLMSASA